MKYALITLLLFATVGCATAGTPIDLIWPVTVPPGVESYLEHPVPNVGGVTTLAVLRAAQEEVAIKRFMNDAEAKAAGMMLTLSIKTGEASQNGAMTLAALLGIPAAGVLGAKKKRKGDFTSEEYEAAGSMAPEDFQKAKERV